MVKPDSSAIPFCSYAHKMSEGCVYKKVLQKGMLEGWNGDGVCETASLGL